MTSPAVDNTTEVGKRAARKRRIRRWLLFGLLPLLVSVLLLEGLARLVGEPPSQLNLAEDPAALQVEALVNGWVLPPPVRGQIHDCERYITNVLHGQRPRSADGELPTSPQGFRDTALVTPKPEGQIRILLLGDSSVYGAEICRLDTLAEQLEAGLNEQFPAGLPGGHRKVEVINAGVPGYSTYQSLEVLKRALKYELDGIIVYNMISDWTGPRGAGDDTWFRYWAPVLRVAGHSAAVRWASHLVTPVVKGAQEKAVATGYEEKDSNRVKLPNYTDNLHEMVSIARSTDAWIAFVVPPVTRDIESSDPDKSLVEDYVIATESQAEALQTRLDEIRVPIREPADYRATMALIAWENGSVIIDGPALLREAAANGGKRATGEVDSLMLDSCHPTPLGNRILARALLPRIKDLL